MSKTNMTQKLKKLYLNAGQMKAGTTYLYSVLRRHKDIFFSPEKEIHYLSQAYGNFKLLSDETRMRKARSMVEIATRLERPIGPYRHMLKWAADYLRPTTVDGWYEDMFDGHRDNQWCADFSNLTCTIPVDRLEQISTLADDMRVTYCIRNAVSRAISHAKFHLKFAEQESTLPTCAPPTCGNCSCRTTSIRSPALRNTSPHCTRSLATNACGLCDARRCGPIPGRWLIRCAHSLAFRRSKAKSTVRQ